MRLTLVQPDRLTLVDGAPQHFDLQKFGVPPNLHALQWNNKEGHIEYSNAPNEALAALPDWTTAVVEEHRRLTEAQQQEQARQAREAVYIGNGQARRERIERQQAVILEQRVTQLENRGPRSWRA